MCEVAGVGGGRVMLSAHRQRVPAAHILPIPGRWHSPIRRFVTSARPVPVTALDRVGQPRHDLAKTDAPELPLSFNLAAAHLVAASSGGKGSGSSFPFLIIVAVFALGFYFFVLRPQRARVRKAQEKHREVDIGSRVMTASGMYGTVAGLEDDAVMIEIAPGVTTRWARAAIARVVETEEMLGLDQVPDQQRDQPPARPDDDDEAGR
jgi:preprotein translocase subunit YajC